MKIAIIIALVAVAVASGLLTLYLIKKYNKDTGGNSPTPKPPSPPPKPSPPPGQCTGTKVGQCNTIGVKGCEQRYQGDRYSTNKHYQCEKKGGKCKARTKTCSKPTNAE